MVGRYELSDPQWQRIAHLLPGKPGDRGRTGADNRLFVNAVLWVLRSGAWWQDLPERYGKWKSIHKRFTRWAKAGAWERVLIVAARQLGRCLHRRVDGGRAAEYVVLTALVAVVIIGAVPIFGTGLKSASTKVGSYIRGLIPQGIIIVSSIPARFFGAASRSKPSRRSPAGDPCPSGRATANRHAFIVPPRVSIHAASISMACGAALPSERVALISRTLMKKALETV
jgi:transposase